MAAGAPYLPFDLRGASMSGSNHPPALMVKKNLERNGMRRDPLVLFGFGIASCLGFWGSSACTQMADIQEGYWIEDWTVSNGDGGQGGTSSTSSGAVCIPFEQAECYSGEESTKNVGRCKAGIKTCNAEGTAFGPCNHEILPQQENCSTEEDDDCDGSSLDEDTGCVCLPGETVACYSGPSNTEGIGTCHAGNATCNLDGKSAGPCIGQVFPALNDCGGADSNCDGVISPCQEPTQWAFSFGASTVEAVTGLVSTPNGSLFVVGDFTKTIDFYGMTTELVNAGSTDIFVAKLDGAGNAAWSKQFGSAGTEQARAIDVDELDGSAVITGMFTGTVDFGGSVLSSAGSTDIYLAKLDMNGEHLWSKQFGDADNQIGRAVHIGSSGDIYLTGSLVGTVDFGPGNAACPPMTASGLEDVFITKFSSSGVCQFSKRFGTPAQQFSTAIAVDSQQNILVTGYFNGGIDFGCGMLASGNGMGGTDIFLAKLDSMGGCIWSKRFGDASNQYATALGIRPSSDEIIIAGYASGTVDFGNAALVSAGGSDIFIAAFNGSGVPLWSRMIGGSGNDAGRALSVTDLGITITGSFSNTVDFGSGPAISVGGTDIFLLNLATDGSYKSSKQFGDAAQQEAYALSITPDGYNLITGTFAGTLDIGMSTLTSNGAEDIFLARLKL